MANKIMKRVLSSLFVAILVVSAVGCSRHRTIKDADLGNIVKEMFLINTYCNEQSFQTDSLDVYEPIFNRYGYSSKDFIYTLGTFSKRKSSRFSDVIEDAITTLEREYEYYSRRVEMLDRIDSMAYVYSQQTVLHDSLITVRTIKDTARLCIVLPAREGSYKVEYYYMLDSLDKNRRLQNTSYIYSADRRRVASNSSWLRIGERTLYSATLKADTSARTLELSLAKYPDKMEKPFLTIDSLYVTYMLPRRQAIARLTHDKVVYLLRVDSTEYDLLGCDSAVQHVVPPFAVPGDGIVADTLSTDQEADRMQQ